MKEHTVATITFENMSPQKYRAIINQAYTDPVSIEIQGDQWQLDARILKWSGPVAYLGLQPVYHLERISGRYNTLKDETKKPRSVIPLDVDQSFNFWNFLIKHQNNIPWLDAYYGSAVYLPMKHGATFMITLGHQGLIARPRNIEAGKSLENWLVPELRKL